MLLMPNTPESIARFLNCRVIAVAGVSRKGDTAASFIMKKLTDGGYRALPVNPFADTIKGVKCFPNLKSCEPAPEAVMIATSPEASADVARECVEMGIKHVWFHRSLGTGSLSDKAVSILLTSGIEPITGGCPLMFIEPVDLFHSCTRWIGQKKGIVPA
jgi:predicted CoA-binding protein